MTQPSIDLEPFFPFVIRPARHRRAIAERDARGARRNEALHENDRRFRELLDALPRGVAHEPSAEVRLAFPVIGVVCEIDAPLA